MNAVSIRGDWVGQIIDGKYPLLEWLGGSGTSAVFRTELPGEGSQKAALRLLLDSPQADDRFAGWSSAASLAHPHLLKVFHRGRAEVEDTRLVYLVTEFADEILSEIIPERPLSGEEAREMLNPVLDALGYLHSNGYIHGHLKPANVLVVENEIKLSSDGLIPSGKPSPELLTNDIYVAPEAASGAVAPPADVWALGITLVETLTQELPIWDAAGNDEPIVPGTLPAPFDAVARECLRRDPSRRCTLAQIRAVLAGNARPSRVAAVPPSTPQPKAPEGLSEKPSLPSRMPFIPLVVGLVLLIAIIVGLTMHSRRTNTAPLQTETTQQAPPAEPDSKESAKQSSQPAPVPAPTAPAPGSSPSSAIVPGASSSGDVVSRDVPDIPGRASNTIHGTVSVIVRVKVDANGNVSDAEFASHGPSAYFARMALDSARNWKFKAPQQNGRAMPSTWLLHYRFRRDGVEVTPNQNGG